MVWFGKLAGSGRGFRVQPVGHEAQGLFLIVASVGHLEGGVVPRFRIGWIFVEILPPDLTGGLVRTHALISKGLRQHQALEGIREGVSGHMP